MHNQTFKSNKKAIYLILPVLIGVLVSALLLYLLLGGKQTNFEDLALGEETTKWVASYDGYPIHVTISERAEKCLEGLNSRGASQSVLWLGNSQLHSINQLKDGDETSSAILFRELNKKSYDLMAYSMPNASTLEHYIVFEYLKTKMPLKKLVIALVFDDFREGDVREDIAIWLRDHDLNNKLKSTDFGSKILNDFYNDDEDDGEEINDKSSNANFSPQEVSEIFLNGWLEENFFLWSLRPEARGQIFGFLHTIRNTAFGITASSKRRRIMGPYNSNMEALSSIIESAKDSGIEVFTYIVPLRDDIPYPYDENEYTAFKDDIKSMAEKNEIQFANLEKVVPGKYWGMKVHASGKVEVDFMHFQAGGHKLLASSVYDFLERRLVDK